MFDISKIRNVDNDLTKSFKAGWPFFLTRTIVELPICQQWERVNLTLETQKTTHVYDVGDKVHVLSDDIRSNYNVRATVMEVRPTGYELLAFSQDVPGIGLSFVWDYQLTPRTSKARLPFKRQNWRKFGSW